MFGLGDIRCLSKLGVGLVHRSRPSEPSLTIDTDGADRASGRGYLVVVPRPAPCRRSRLHKSFRSHLRSFVSSDPVGGTENSIRSSLTAPSPSLAHQLNPLANVSACEKRTKVVVFLREGLLNASAGSMLFWSRRPSLVFRYSTHSYDSPACAYCIPIRVTCQAGWGRDSLVPTK